MNPAAAALAETPRPAGRQRQGHGQRVDRLSLGQPKHARGGGGRGQRRAEIGRPHFAIENLRTTHRSAEARHDLRPDPQRVGKISCVGRFLRGQHHRDRHHH
jgi:hypothetical protein